MHKTLFGAAVVLATGLGAGGAWAQSTAATSADTVLTTTTVVKTVATTVIRPPVSANPIAPAPAELSEIQGGTPIEAPGYAGDAVYPFPDVPVALADVPSAVPFFYPDEPIIWHPGSWDWTGRSYVWSFGHWERLGHHAKAFMPGYWAPYPSAKYGYVWIPSHWLPAG